MKKILFILFAAVCLAGCGNDNEPTPPTNNDNYNDTSTNTTPSKPSEPSTPQYKPTKDACILFSNKALFEYDFYVDDKFVKTLRPNEACNYEIKSGTYEVKMIQVYGEPAKGDFAGKKIKLRSSITLDPNEYKAFTHSSATTLKIINTDKKHRYEIIINGGTVILPFAIAAGGSVEIPLDQAYYNIEMNQLDWILWPTNYEKDIYIDNSYEIKI